MSLKDIFKRCRSTSVKLGHRLQVPYLGLFFHVLLVKLFSECRALHSLIPWICLQLLFHFTPSLASLYVLVTQKIKEVLSDLGTKRTC